MPRRVGGYAHSVSHHAFPQHRPVFDHHIVPQDAALDARGRTDLGACTRVDPFARCQQQRRLQIVGRRADVEELACVRNARTAPGRAAISAGYRVRTSEGVSAGTEANAAGSATWTPTK